MAKLSKLSLLAFSGAVAYVAALPQQLSDVAPSPTSNRRSLSTGISLDPISEAISTFSDLSLSPISSFHVQPSAASKPSYGIRGPVIDHTFADPSIIQIDGTWYSFGTADPRYHIQIAKSPDFEHWTYVHKDALPDISKAKWIVNGDKNGNGQPWAPDVIHTPGGKFLMQFSAPGTPTNGQRCLGVAVAEHIDGPYKPEPTPFRCGKGDNNGLIDASFFHDADDGTLWLAYKDSLHDGPNQGTRIMVQQLKNSGSRWGLDPQPGTQPTEILHNEPGDGNDTEAPYITKRNGVYFLTFSTHLFSTPKYNVEYATASKVNGKYARAKKPLLATDDFPQLDGPGGASFARHGDHMVFHNRYHMSGRDANATDASDITRTLWTGTVRYDAHVMSFGSKGSESGSVAQASRNAV